MVIDPEITAYVEYEGRLGVGGRNFKSLAKHPGLSPEAAAELVCFQQSLPNDCYSFIYEGPERWPPWLSTEDYVLEIKDAERRAALSIIAVLGGSYDHHDYEELARVAQVIAKKADVLRQSKVVPSFDLRVMTQPNFMAWHIALKFGAPEEDRSMVHIYYRLR